MIFDSGLYIGGMMKWRSFMFTAAQVRKKKK